MASRARSVELFKKLYHSNPDLVLASGFGIFGMFMAAGTLVRLRQLGPTLHMHRHEYTVVRGENVDWTDEDKVQQLYS